MKYKYVTIIFLSVLLAVIFHVQNYQPAVAASHIDYAPYSTPRYYDFINRDNADKNFDFDHDYFDDRLLDEAYKNEDFYINKILDQLYRFKYSRIYDLPDLDIDSACAIRPISRAFAYISTHECFMSEIRAKQRVIDMMDLYTQSLRFVSKRPSILNNHIIQICSLQPEYDYHAAADKPRLAAAKLQQGSYMQLEHCLKQSIQLTVPLDYQFKRSLPWRN